MRAGDAETSLMKVGSSEMFASLITEVDNPLRPVAEVDKQLPFRGFRVKWRTIVLLFNALVARLRTRRRSLLEIKKISGFLVERIFFDGGEREI
jgi:hypothetical protein